MSDLPSTIPKRSWIETIQDGLCIASQQVTSDIKRFCSSLTQSGQQEWELINRSTRFVPAPTNGGRSFTEVTLDWKLTNYSSTKNTENPTIMASEFDLLYTDITSILDSQKEPEEDSTAKRAILHFEGAAPTSTNIDGILSYNPPIVEQSMVRPRVVRRGNL
ncbi:hypothetical protein I203_106310 [Kwoniella mangroviensis CBS 8507]|uniref:uncharacterized protein n=1 Tax=Kwoniella mangroviensis CBS 8507 TaxID=1296122 RepID=UPI00080D249C|nr:uncharacterized protein I203_07588 [Kwoniella mangroviensis CBS 8507]OCF63164.1 hypothetical protein I203_07588 [Kwoniella mangroviensis CBS 8507]